MTHLRFLFDEHVSKPACDKLRELGVDVVHVLDVGLAGASDTEVFAHAAAEGRIVITRNYRDFARLVEAYSAKGKPSAAVLFLPTSLSPADVGGHVRALEEWIAAQPVGRNSVANGFGWIGVA